MNKETEIFHKNRQYSLLVAIVMLLLIAGMSGTNETLQASEAYIVQGQSMVEAKTAVTAVGAQITHELSLINAVGAELTPRQLAKLEGTVRLYSDSMVQPNSPR